MLFKALFPGILSGIQGLNGIEWYCGPLSGISSGILFPVIQGLLQRQALNSVVSLLPQSSAGMQGVFLGI